MTNLQQGAFHPRDKSLGFHASRDKPKPEDPLKISHREYFDPYCDKNILTACKKCNINLGRCHFKKSPHYECLNCWIEARKH